MVKPVKLSKRLQQIEQMVSEKYDHIWDCCCDHGFLGAALLDSVPANPRTIHFVDIVPKLMQSLEQKLVRFYQGKRWHTHCLDVADIPLNTFSGRHLIIIAGIGGDLMIELICALKARHPTLALDFLLCPVHHQFALRKTLQKLDLRLVAESLIKDNRRFYEIIHVTSSQYGEVVSPIGESIWRSECSHQTMIIKEYLSKTLGHYRRMTQGG
ncbi:tRNA (adenine(22)-N(1))-methyltransferase [Vibrio viridaestus]|uniref:SAM-dependent methyltransferase n=1 Tax=Vibrio viridaestus TaxID=2487322 RepID=A0A3N9TFN2_9VIBR|nr:tRNA (adenine(22)-N(1))-methyltransferase TrmK [Vibrio viridaestus]RQW62543.1 SAM-dependent methyltransferase [Vibrio viridaestus]